MTSRFVAWLRVALWVAALAMARNPLPTFHADGPDGESSLSRTAYRVLALPARVAEARKVAVDSGWDPSELAARFFSVRVSHFGVTRTERPPASPEGFARRPARRIPRMNTDEPPSARAARVA